MPVIVVKGARALQKEIKKGEEKTKRALFTAMRVEGFTLMKQLRKEIRKGSPGGKAFKPLQTISSPRKRPPLRRLATIVHYRVTKKSHPPEVEVGFIGMRGMPLSKSWTRITKQQQAGFSIKIPKWQREQLARSGAAYSKRSKRRKYYFLKKSTRQFKIPARPIIKPFWKKYEPVSAKRIGENWLKKLRGERI